VELLVVVPLSARNESLFETNLDLVKHLDPKGTGFSMLITHDGEVRISELAKKARESFVSVFTMKRNSIAGVKEYPVGENRVWQQSARYVEANFAKSDKGWFWWEQDACPLRSGWLKTIKKVWQEGGKPFCGYVYRGPTVSPFMDRCGVWPTHVTRFLQGGTLYVTNAPFDRIAGLEALPNTCESNYVLTTQSDTFRLSKIEQRYPDAVLLRGCHGMVQEVLQGKREVSDVDEAIAKNFYPSYLEQTEWDCGMFAFPFLENGCYFNPGLARVRGKLQLFTRQFQYGVGRIEGEQTTDKKSRLVVWEIDERTMSVKSTNMIPVEPKRHVNEQWEDPRAIVHDGEVYVGFATWVRTKDWKIRQALTKLDWDLEKFDVIVEPEFGGNHPRPEAASGHEKNWQWFVHDGLWHCVYSPSPQMVFRLDERLRVQRHWKGKHRMKWDFGDIRGGSPPGRLNDDEYLSFFHSALQWRGPKRRYYMGAYTFEAKAPFEVKRMTSVPLLVGSERDFRAWESPLVIFAEGHVYEEGVHLVTFGVNDEQCGWIKIPNKDLMKRLERV